MAKFSRRKFLFATGWVAGGVTALYLLRNRATAVAPTIIFPDAASGAAWLQIRPDGNCRMLFPRMDMGQNANTGLAQIAAEELNIQAHDIEGVVPSTDRVPPFAVTAGSMSLTAFSRPVAIAAATLREHLRARAATKLNVPLSAVFDARGGFTTADQRTLGYADLVDQTDVMVDIDADQPLPKLYSFDSTRVKQQVGHNVSPLGIRGLVTGAPVYSADVPMTDVLYGRVVQPPVRNARIAGLDTSGIDAVQGFIRLVHDGDFVGVVCKTPSAVDAAMAKVRVTWDLQQPINQNAIDQLVDVDAALAEGELKHVLQDNAHRKDVEWQVDLRFDVQVQSHAAQEPRAAIARFNSQGPHRLEIWTGTQDPFGINRFASMDTGLSEDEVVVHPQRMGGGFGGREHYEVERDAVRLARAMNQPVKVQWTRADEFTAGRNRPASTHRLRIAADADGNLSDWWYAYVTGYVTFARERLPNWLLPVVRLGDDMGVVKGALAPYAASHQRVECKDVDLPVDLGVWRSLNGAPAIFAIESAMDELAVQLDVEPVAFKIAQMRGDQPRLQGCLEKVQVLSAKRTLPQGAGCGRGFAAGIYDGRCFVAVSADVYIDPQSQQIKVLHMCCAQDVGLAVNPDQLRAQIESNLAWSIGMALLEKLEVGNDDIQSSNFDNYSIPRMADMPSLDIEVIDQPTIPSTGAGEVALVAGPPAIANAIRNASGFRPLRLPITYADVAAG
jgi:CO/xanthine dehydrogenase Mo-binding subunit